MSDIKAFPASVSAGASGDVYMSGFFENAEGMDLRDYFAAKAMQGMLANDTNETEMNAGTLSAWSYQIADAMLKARGEHD